MKVTSSETIYFNAIGWGITKGEERELPADKAAAAVILAHESITEVGKAASNTSKKQKPGVTAPSGPEASA